jgi:hypothetical protein
LGKIVDLADRHARGALRHAGAARNREALAQLIESLERESQRALPDSATSSRRVENLLKLLVALP